MLRGYVNVPVHKVTVLCFFLLLTTTAWYWASALVFTCLPDFFLTDKTQGSLCASTKPQTINMNLLEVSPYLRPHPMETFTNRTEHNARTSHRDKQHNTTKSQVLHTSSNSTRRDTGLELVSMAKALTSVNQGPLLLTIVNKGYLPLTFNWLCHTAELPGVHENMIFLVQGRETEMRLNHRWPNIKTLTVNQTNDELLGPLKFGTVGYVRMMVRRTELLNALVKANISFLLFETDFIWFENPVPDFIKMGQEKDLDLVGTVSTAKTQLMCGAFIYFRTTTRTRTLWAEVTRQMHELEDKLSAKEDEEPAPFRQNEQVYLNSLLKANFTEARYGLVDYGIVVDGKWYKMKSPKRKAMKPKAIHNNFQTTPQEKLHRFQRFGQTDRDREV